jgi:hypothetical protein
LIFRHTQLKCTIRCRWRISFDGTRIGQVGGQKLDCLTGTGTAEGTTVMIIVVDGTAATDTAIGRCCKCRTARHGGMVEPGCQCHHGGWRPGIQHSATPMYKRTDFHLVSLVEMTTPLCLVYPRRYDMFE